MTAALACVVVVVVGIVIALKIASGALVVGPTNMLTLHMALALSASRLVRRFRVISIRAVQPDVAVVKQASLSLSTLTTKHTVSLKRRQQQR